MGAWLLHHEQKLLKAQTTEFESIVTAGRSARLLSAISREEDTRIPYSRVKELARGIGIREIEIDGLLRRLTEHGLIQASASEVAVLGVAQSTLLEHAANIFESQAPQHIDRAVIELAELGSRVPIRRSDCEEELADEFRLSSAEIDDVFTQSEQIGFVDYERDGGDRLYFNGSLFRRDSAAKANLILNSLSLDEADRLLGAEERIRTEGCVIAAELRQLLGHDLWTKLHQIGYFDVSVVANERGTTEFVSKPDALTKYVPSGLADMLDDAKALASSLTYGIVKSSQARGRINEPARLINVLIDRGFVEGWASAIKLDYQVLERRGVVEVTTTDRGNRLTLLKTEVAEMARDLVLKGDASATAAEVIVGNSAVTFVGPEGARMVERRKAVPETKTGTSRSLDILRKSSS